MVSLFCEYSNVLINIRLCVSRVYIYSLIDFHRFYGNDNIELVHAIFLENMCRSFAAIHQNTARIGSYVSFLEHI